MRSGILKYEWINRASALAFIFDPARNEYGIQSYADRVKNGPAYYISIKYDNQSLRRAFKNFAYGHHEAVTVAIVAYDREEKSRVREDKIRKREAKVYRLNSIEIERTIARALRRPARYDPGMFDDWRPSMPICHGRTTMTIRDGK